ncbi:MAG: 16S rRNA (cytosine(967)-C(5))-methyltransferase RsmB [Terracidiphilus sp.]
MAAISPARKAAFDVLLAVERGKAHADDLLRARAVDALSPADRHLATTLVLGVLRWQILLDEQLRTLIKKPKAKLDREVSIALRMGAFQLRFLDRVPAHAAIDESVELTKRSGHRFATGLVNAVLRKFAAAGPAHEIPEESASELALAYAHPAWLVERWTRFYGLDAARQICQHGQAQPARTIRLVNPAAETELLTAGLTLEPEAMLTSARSVTSGDVTATAAFREGRARIQDEGSQLIAELAACSGNALNQDQEKILDACAAPGGKTLILAERNPQARILACESNPRRLSEFRERLAACAGSVECRLANATVLNEESAFDLVLADVPCSGTGTLGRNPEIRHRLRPEDLPRHAERQRAILSAALRSLRPRGHVVYSTCSLEPEENEQVVAAVLAENQNARQVSLESRIAALEKAGILTAPGAAQLRGCLTPDGALRLLPGALPTDGFYAALIEKTA